LVTIARGIAAPRMKIKKGKTKSVGVHPFHSACSSGAKMFPQLPGLFTKTIIIMVIPRNTSREIIRSFIYVNFDFLAVIYGIAFYLLSLFATNYLLVAISYRFFLDLIFILQLRHK
jgi:hypothetical protein